MADNINVSERNTLPVLNSINVSIVILLPHQHYIYVSVASRNRTLVRITVLRKWPIKFTER